MTHPEQANQPAAASQPAQQRPGGAAQRKTTTESGGTAATSGAEATAAASGAEAAAPREHTLTVTVPLDRAIDVAKAPVTTAGRVLSSMGGLPVYVGLGVLAVAEIIEWPVAVAAGAGYAVLRRWGPLRPASTSPAKQADKTEPARS